MSWERPLKRRKVQQRAGPLMRPKASKGDVKYCDSTGTGVGVDYTGLISSAFTNLTHGDGALNQFNGNSLTVINWTVKYEVTLGAAGSTNMLRVMLFQWDSSAAVTPAGILQTTGSVIAPLSAKNANVYPNIRVLSDKVYTLNDNNPNEVDTIYISGKKLTPVEFVPTGVSINKGALYLLAISDDGAVAYPQFKAFSRVTFND